MKRKVGINIDCVKGHSPLDTLELIKAQGFECFFTGEYIVDYDEVARIKERGERLGLSYEFIHAPFRSVNGVWGDEEQAKPFVDGIVNAIDNASRCAVPYIILHASSGWTPPPMNEQGFKRYDYLVSYAKERGVGLAIENLRIYDYYAKLIERYKNFGAVYFCYDNGHEHCYNFDADHIAVFKDIMKCTHIHDNFGKTSQDPSIDDDLHFLPFDGNFDYAQMIRRMDENGYDGPLTLEVFNSLSPCYENLSAEEFIKTCYDRIVKIANM